VGPDLYATLGVDRGADRAAIRRAYRNQAKKAHPDGGGSPRQFALVKLAVDVLTDDLRRAKYDQTGEFEEAPVDNAKAELLGMLATGLDMALGKLYEQAKPPIHNDMVRLTKLALQQLRDKLASDRHEIGKRVVIAKELLGRWSSKGENLMEELTAQRVKVSEEQIASITNRIGVVDKAIAVLDDASFRFDYVPAPSPAQNWMGQMHNIPGAFYQYPPR
jgi:curved DNA-binding protein CbpA